jgi:hypothetical protein
VNAPSETSSSSVVQLLWTIGGANEQDPFFSGSGSILWTETNTQTKKK